MDSASKQTSVWLATTPATTYPPLTSGIHVDVALLGGGIAGLMTAYLLKQQGKSVAVIEARRIASGTTGYTTAHISVAHDLIYDELVNRFGDAAARTYAQANQTGIETIAEIVRNERISCDFDFVDEHLFSPLGADAGPLNKEYEAVKRLGLNVQYLDKAPLPFDAGPALRYTRQAQFHPRRFLLALADRITGDDSYIFEGTRAIDVHDDEPLRIETDQGSLTADDVIVTTLYPFMDRGLYFARLSVYSSYVVAVLINDDFPEAMFDSTEEHSHYLRRQPYESGYVVLVGGEGHKTGEVSDTTVCYQRLETYARKHLNVRSILYRWSTHDTYPPDRVPYIGPYLPTSEHLYVATGFQGWGMSHSAVAGILLRDLIAGKSNPWADLYNPGRFKPRASAGELIKRNTKVGEIYLKSKFAREPKIDVSDLKTGEWQLYESNGEKVAAYRDENGEVHAVSAYCRHLGCTVSFNHAEKTWDCPCHGSRYSLDGSVLYGPTVKGLPEAEMNKNDD